MPKLSPADKAKQLRTKAVQNPLVAGDVLNDMPKALLRQYGMRWGNYLAIVTLERRLGDEYRWKVVVSASKGIDAVNELGPLFELVSMFLSDLEMAEVAFHQSEVSKRSVVFNAPYLPAPWDEEQVALELGIETVAGEHRRSLLGDPIDRQS